MFCLYCLPAGHSPSRISWPLRLTRRAPGFIDSESRPTLFATHTAALNAAATLDAPRGFRFCARKIS